MKSLKTILGLIYPILIILLLLNRCGSNQNDGITPPPPPPPSPVHDSNNQRLPEPEEVQIDSNETTSIVRQAEEVGESGALKITLLWNFNADIDLHVVQPNGRRISFQHMKDPSTGGYLDVDNKDGGNRSAENVFWREPPTGQYQIFLHYYGPSHSTGIAEFGPCSVVVFREGQAPVTYNVIMNRANEMKPIDVINIQ